MQAQIANRRRNLYGKVPDARLLRCVRQHDQFVVFNSCGNVTSAPEAAPYCLRNPTHTRFRCVLAEYFKVSLEVVDRERHQCQCAFLSRRDCPVVGEDLAKRSVVQQTGNRVVSRKVSNAAFCIQERLAHLGVGRGHDGNGAAKPMGCIVSDVFPVVLCNPAFEAISGEKSAIKRPFADVVEQLVGRELALEISESVRSGQETSIPVELSSREYLLVIRPMPQGDGKDIRYYAAYWLGGAVSIVSAADLRERSDGTDRGAITRRVPILARREPDALPRSLPASRCRSYNERGSDGR